MARVSGATRPKTDEDAAEPTLARIGPRDVSTDVSTHETVDVPVLPASETAGLTLPPAALRALVAEEEERREIIRDFIARNLKTGTDYGTVSSGGRESKPSLFKPGAEKICLLFRVRPHFVGDRATLAMAGNPPGLFAYVCRLVDGAGNVVGEGRGAADLNERDGWTVNNAIKMAEKRAQVDAVLRVAGLSEIFTQDLEDQAQRQAYEHETAHPRAAASPPPAAPARPSPMAAEPAAGYAPAPAAPDTDADADADADAEAPCTEAQQRAIRARLAGAGMSEEDLLTRLQIGALAELSQDRATKVVDWLVARARKRSQG